MAGTSLLAALKARYETVAAADWPRFFSGTQPEGEARDLPNMVLIDGGEPPVYQADGAGRLLVVKIEAEFQFVFYAATEEQADELSRTLQTVMEGFELEVYGDTHVQLYRGKYRRRFVPRRGPAGQYMYEAVTPYKASINPASE